MKENRIDLSEYKSNFSTWEKICRVVWNVVWILLARPLPRNVGRKWKVALVNLFGGKIHPTASIYSSVRIYLPWNLQMDEYSCLAPEVDCYNVAFIHIGANSTVSQRTYLCSASHDITKTNNPLLYEPIVIEDQVWIGAEAFVGMGVCIAQGAVVGARACVFKNVDKWVVVGGNPAKFIKNREIKND